MRASVSRLLFVSRKENKQKQAEVKDKENKKPRKRAENRKKIEEQVKEKTTWPSRAASKRNSRYLYKHTCIVTCILINTEVGLFHF